MVSQKLNPFAQPPSDQAGNFSTYVVDTQKGVVQTDGSAEEHARVLEMTRALIELCKASAGATVPATAPLPGQQTAVSRKSSGRRSAIGRPSTWALCVFERRPRSAGKPSRTLPPMSARSDT